MNLFRLYGRVLLLLGPEARLGWFLAFANLALSAAMFAEPVLCGRIIDALAGSQTAGAEPLTFSALLPLLGQLVDRFGDRVEILYRQREPGAIVIDFIVRA